MDGYVGECMGSRCKDVQELSRVESNSLEFHRKSCLSWLLLVGGRSRDRLMDGSRTVLDWFKRRVMHLESRSQMDSARERRGKRDRSA